MRALCRSDDRQARTVLLQTSPPVAPESRMRSGGGELPHQQVVVRGRRIDRLESVLQEDCAPGQPGPLARDGGHAPHAGLPSVVQAGLDEAPAVPLVLVPSGVRPDAVKEHVAGRAHSPPRVLAGQPLRITELHAPVTDQHARPQPVQEGAAHPAFLRQSTLVFGVLDSAERRPTQVVWRDVQNLECVVHGEPRALTCSADAGSPAPRRAQVGAAKGAGTGARRTARPRQVPDCEARRKTRT
jgi:hypothetical protein